MCLAHLLRPWKKSMQMRALKGKHHWLLGKFTPELTFHSKSFLDQYLCHLFCSHLICELPGQTSLHNNPLR